MEPPKRPRARLALLLIALIAAAHATAPAAAQTVGCALVPDAQDPSEQILKCGNDLTIRREPGARYQFDNPAGRPPDNARLESGALMIEFNPSAPGRTFQIQTPLAIASVRGTKWVVDSQKALVSTFVITGHVAVTRRSDGRSALLGPGEGADVDARPGPVVVKRWPPARVKALLARFGQ